MNITDLKESLERMMDEHSANQNIEITQFLIEHLSLNEEMSLKSKIKNINQYIDDFFKNARMNLLNKRNLQMFKAFMIIKTLELEEYVNEAISLIDSENDEAYGNLKFETKRFSNEDFWFVNEVITKLVNTELKTKGNKVIFTSEDENKEVYHLKVKINKKKKDDKQTNSFKK